MIALRTCLVLALLTLGITAKIVSDIDSLTKDTELLLSFVVFRHGDRTPLEDQFQYADDPETIKKLSAPYSHASLNELGQDRGYLIGEFVRSRYNSHLSPKYNSTEIYIRSTDMQRTKMTTLMAFTSLYSSESHSWNKNLNWEYVPYTTEPTNSDFMCAYKSCPRMRNYLLKFFATQPLNQTENPKFERFNYLFDIISEKIGFDLKTNPYFMYYLYDIYQSEISLGMTFQPWLQEIYDDLEEVVNVVADELFRPAAVQQLTAGVLHNNFLETAAAIMDDEVVTQKIQLYGGHDQNVGAHLSLILAPQGIPPYGSVFAMELRKTASGDYAVLPVYMRGPGDVQAVHVGGCSETLCPFDEFVDLTARHALTEDEWKVACVVGDEIGYY